MRYPRDTAVVVFDVLAKSLLLDYLSTASIEKFLSWNKCETIHLSSDTVDKFMLEV